MSFTAQMSLSFRDSFFLKHDKWSKTLSFVIGFIGMML